MAAVQKRTWASGKTTYIVRWPLPDGSEASKAGFRTRKQANAYATEVEHRLQRGIAFDPKAGGITFREAAQEWLNSRHDLKPSTFDGYRYALAPTAKRRGDMQHLGIDAVFGGYPLNAIKREDIALWVQRMLDAGKAPSTVRHAYFIVSMVLAQAVEDGRLPANPADYVKLPTKHSTGNPGVVDDPEQFLTPTQVQALVDATPWPFNVYVHVAAWSGLRAAELCGLQVADVELPPNRPGVLRVERTVRVINGTNRYLTPKTRGSRRKVPLTAEATALLRDFLAEHPKAHIPSAPLFPAIRLTVPKPTGVKAVDAAGTAEARQATALAKLTVAEAEARLVLDWDSALRHGVFYNAVYRPAVLRAQRLHPNSGLSAALKFHSLRHTYASLCVAAGIPALEISRFMGHNRVTTTLGI
jgi:integrase